MDNYLWNLEFSNANATKALDELWTQRGANFDGSSLPFGYITKRETYSGKIGSSAGQKSVNIFSKEKVSRSTVTGTTEAEPNLQPKKLKHVK